MLKTLIPLALAVVALNGCSDAQSADTQVNAEADVETVAQLAIAAASEVSASSTTLTGAFGTAQVGGIFEDVASYIRQTYSLPVLLPHIGDMATALDLVFHLDLHKKCGARSNSVLFAGAVLHLQGGRRRSKRPPHTLIAQSVSDATFNTRASLRAEMEFSKAVSVMAIPALDSDCQIK